MKNLILLIAIVGAGYYYYTNHYAVATPVAVDSYQALLKKVESAPVTKAEVIFGVNDLSRQLCNGDSTRSSSDCLSKYSNYKEICEGRIFGRAPETYTRKEDVVSTAHSYRECVGIR